MGEDLLDITIIFQDAEDDAIHRIHVIPQIAAIGVLTRNTRCLRIAPFCAVGPVPSLPLDRHPRCPGQDRICTSKGATLAVVHDFEVPWTKTKSNVQTVQPHLSFFNDYIIWGFIKNPVLSITSSWEIGF